MICIPDNNGKCSVTLLLRLYRALTRFVKLLDMKMAKIMYLA